MRRAVLPLAALAFVNGAMATPVMARQFYLTVERSFSTDERPQVRLDFTRQDTPLVLRVLKPRDVDRFLDGQLNISRSYEEPLAAVNPGHYVLRALNDVDSPLPLLRSTLNPELRRSLRSEVLQHSLQEPPNQPAAAVPPEVTHVAPDGFDLVREEFIDLQKGGEVAVGLYGDFNWGEETRYKVRSLDLDPLPDGLYLLQATQGTFEAQALLQVSSLSVQVKQSAAQLVVRVIDRQLQPVQGAVVDYRDGRGVWQHLAARTNAQGELYAEDPGRFDGRLLVRARADERRSAITETDFLPASSEDPSVFVVTDRPIFKPGDTFFYKGTVRLRQGGQLSVPPGEGAHATVHLLRQDGSDTGVVQDVALSSFGSFSGQIDLDRGETPGLYRLAAEVGGKRYGGELRVRDYVKPTFYLELVRRDAVLNAGQPFHLTFRARRYAGGVPEGAKYEVFVYRKRFEAPAWVDEAGGGLETNHDYFGAVRSATALSEPQRLYSSVEARLADGRADSSNPWGSAPLIERSGDVDVEITLPVGAGNDANQDWIYTFVVRALERAGSTAVLTENVYVTLAQAAVAARFKQVVSEAGSHALQLGLRTTYPDTTLAPNGVGEVRFRLDGADGKQRDLPALPFRTDDKGEATLSVPRPEQPGRLQATAVLQGLGEQHFARPFTAEPSVAVVAAPEGDAIVQNQQLELLAERTVLAPGERARVLAMLPAGWGKQESGVVWETHAGSKIFANQAQTVHGRSHWFDVEARPEYGTGIYETVTLPIGAGKFQEQTIGFRIVPSDKRLSIAIAPAAAIAEPMKPFDIDLAVRDHLGKPAPDTELSVNVVDRAVYAVQPEFRPGIVSFFYPLPRLNVGTFYSDDLQGYGYAAELVRPNFRLGALKSNVQIAKRDMRDTAGWFPHVVTDTEGRARVTVDMPANITEWLVTAVAADRQGRIGEDTGGFRSATDVSFEPLVPRFLRRGDVVKGSLAAQNHLDQAVQFDLALRTSGGVLVGDLNTWSGLEVTAKGETLLPIELAPASEVSGSSEGILEIRPSAGDVRTGGPSSVAIALHPDSVEQPIEARREGAQLKFDVPPEAGSGRLTVRLLNGMLGAALSGAAQLVSYPYGCTEQLAHSTLPNLMLLDLQRQAGLDQQGLRTLGLAASVERAQANARLGVQRLTGNQKSDGSFGLWPGDEKGSLMPTILAARTLRLAAELDVPGSHQALRNARSWLEEQLRSGDALPTSDTAPNALQLYELQMLGEAGISYESAAPAAVLVARAVNHSDSSVDELVAALSILERREREYWFDSELEKISSGLTAKSATTILGERLKQHLRPLPSSEDVAQACRQFRQVGFCYGAAVPLAGVMAALHAAGGLDDETRAALSVELIDRMRDGWWRSTFDTAEVLYRLRNVLAAESAAWRAAQAEGPQKRFVRMLAGTETFELTPFPGGFMGNFPIESAQHAAALEIDGKRDNEVASGSLRVSVPIGAARAYSRGLQVERTLQRISANGSEPVAANALARGDTVVSTVTIRRDAPNGAVYDASPSDFVVVEDGLPALAEGVEDDRAYLADAHVRSADDSFWADVKETHRYPERTVRVMTLRPGAAVSVHQVWRAAFGGKALVPPPRAYDMYDDEVAGAGMPAVIEAQ